MQYPYDTHTPQVNYGYTITYTGQLYVSRVDKATNTEFYNGPSNGGGNAPAMTIDRATTSTGTVPAPTLGPCLNRTYTNQVPTANNATLNPDDENPSTVSFNYTFNVAFGVTQPFAGSRDPMVERSRVILPYDVEYYIDRIGADGPRTTIASTTTIDAGTFFQTSNGSISPTTTFAISIPAQLVAGDRVCFRVRIPLRSTGNPTGGVGQTAITGQPPGYGAIIDNTTSTPLDSPEVCTGYAVDRPYFRVYNGDVSAGSSFASGASCPSNSASIIGWNKGASSADYAGAGTQLLAFATAPIQEFASAQLRSIFPGAPKGLSFANNVSAETFGGSLADSAGCITNYFSRISDATDHGGDKSSLASATGRHRYNPGLEISNTDLGSLIRRRLTIYVDGDVSINGNITYPASYASIDEVPMLRIVARNIYIAPGVANVDAILVAQPTNATTDGVIYTCSNGSFDAPTIDQIVNGVCRNTKLTVNGSLIARRVQMLRSIGSLRGSIVSEGSGSGNIAESINYGPEFWMVNPLDSSATSGVPEYDDFTGLPPVL